MNSYSTGAVSGVGTYVGGLIGKTTVGNNSLCFWDKEASGLSTSSGGAGKTTAEMKALATFAGWDFASLWAICEGTNYPRLKWQIPATDWVCPDGVAVEDLVYLAGRWMAGTPATVGAADADGNGKVDLNDFVLLSEQWMK